MLTVSSSQRTPLAAFAVTGKRERRPVGGVLQTLLAKVRFVANFSLLVSQPF
jgi:hypothetical protein